MSSRPLNLIEKILSQHLLSDSEVAPGNNICVRVDWTMSSEIAWSALYKAYAQLGKPGAFRGDRIWLAADHIVDPRINEMEMPKKLIQLAEKSAKELGIVDYHKPNTTIMHTEFYRERAQPGMLVIGADSHTCSSGGLAALAVGLGASDVIMPLVTGETFFQVPDTVRIEFTGKPKFGVSGKDVILHVLGVFKRNTIAAQRVVEYGGDGLKYLSCDARFAIANMSTEFGALGGVFEPDQQTAAFVNRRTNPIHRQQSMYFKPDEGAEYCEKHVIDLASVVPGIAIYPSPDNVVPIEDKAGMKLDGCFIGACTTTEEELIMGALVLKAGLDSGMVPVKEGNRRVTPGSLPVIARLKQLGLLEYYEKAGFTVGVPGCSYCVGMGADRAGEGEVWLSSQNRNFQNRMGKGSIANLSSAASVAASSFNMEVTHPQKFFDMIDMEYYESVRAYWSDPGESIMYTEPKLDPIKPVLRSEAYKETTSELPIEITSRVQRFGNDVDTDAIIPIDKCMAETTEELGQGTFAYVRPEFVQRVQDGQKIVVAERGFGSGSSREEAPKALKACGVQAVIARSFAYIYNRNQANIALFGVRVNNDEFYSLAQEGSEVTIKVAEKKVYVEGKSFPFRLDAVELMLQQSGGIMKRWQQDGKQLFRKLQSDLDEQKKCGTNAELAW